MTLDSPRCRSGAGRRGRRRSRSAKDDRFSRLRDAAFLFVAGLLIAGGSAILVWPLWKFATVHRALYAAFIGLALLAFALWKLAKRLLAVRRIKAAGHE